MSLIIDNRWENVQSFVGLPLTYANIHIYWTIKLLEDGLMSFPDQKEKPMYCCLVLEQIVIEVYRTLKDLRLKALRLYAFSKEGKIRGRFLDRLMFVCGCRVRSGYIL